MLPEKSIDIKENDLLKIDPELLAILLKDKTTGNNIIWATDNYSKYGFSYSAEKEIKIELITMIKTHSVSREYSYPGLFTKIPSIPWQFKNNEIASLR